MIPMILYASETGNAQDTAERVARAFRANNRAVSCLPMDAFPISSLPHTYLLILITSTHGRGDPPPAMLPLWKAMLRTSLPEDILEDVHFAVFGLGDSSYERFCFAGKMLLRRMEQLGANKMSEPAWGDERSPNGIEDAFVPWLQETLDLFIPYLPPAKLEITSPLPTTDLPPPIYALKKYTQPPADDLDLGRLSISPAPNGTSAPTRQEDKIRNKASGSRVKPDDWVWATLKKNERVTNELWWQDVRDIELEFEEEDVNAYPPGSICSLQPQSRESDVNSFLELMDLESQADDLFTIESLLPEQPLPAHLPPAGTPTSIRSLLTNHLDIQCCPRKSFFEWLRRFSPEELERERLDEFIADPDEIHTYATRPSRTLVETLADFRFTRIPLSHLLEALPPLRRRQFSIASSYQAHPNKVQLLIALVQYKTNLSLPRVGLCSSWLSSSLKPGMQVPIHIAAPTLFLPEDKEVPCIFVGPGTGVAPMRAFVEVRAEQGACENTALYFGCRSTESDYYFSSEWDTYRQKGIRVEVAASRDQDEKVYVQHLIKRDKVRVKEWIVDRKGWLFISGASNAMPREVREAVAWCISEEGAGDFTEEEAKEYVERMFEDKRGGEESW